MSARISADRPTTNEEAQRVAVRAQRWSPGTFQAIDGSPARPATRFTTATVAAFEAMLRDNGWHFDDSDPLPWRHADPQADRSTFVRAVRLTLQAMAGWYRIDGIAVLPKAVQP